MLFTGLGRSVLGKTVPCLESQFFPIRTSRPVNNIYLLKINRQYTGDKLLFSYVLRLKACVMVLMVSILCDAYELCRIFFQGVIIIFDYKKLR